MLVHGQPLVYQHDAFGSWWTVSQSAVRSDGVVVVAPPLDQDLGFAQRVKNLAVQQFVPEPCRCDRLKTGERNQNTARM